MAPEPEVGVRVRVCHSDGYWYYGSLESKDEKKGKFSVAFDDGDKIVVALPHRDIQVLAAGERAAAPCPAAATTHAPSATPALLRPPILPLVLDRARSSALHGVVHACLQPDALTL